MSGSLVTPRAMARVLMTAALLTAAPAAAATFVFTGERSNVNVLNPPGTGRCAPTYTATVNIQPDRLSSSGTSNFGAFTSTQSHCIVTRPPTTVVEGLFTYNFDAGDSLFGTYVGDVTATAIDGTFNAMENLTVTGGTGRFLNAVGTLNTLGTLVIGPNPQGMGFVGTFNGTVNGMLDLPAVPEPATWATMIAGFGLVGSAMRRRGSIRAVA